MMEKIEAPVMGEYEVQRCPVCGAVPKVSIGLDSGSCRGREKYTIYAAVYCEKCDLSAPSVEVWNRLRYDAPDVPVPKGEDFPE